MHDDSPVLRELDPAQLEPLLRLLLEGSGDHVTVVDAAVDPPRVVAATAPMIERMGRPLVGSVLGAGAPDKVRAYLWELLRRTIVGGPQRIGGQWHNQDNIGSLASTWTAVDGPTARYVVIRSLDAERVTSVGTDAAAVEVVLEATSAERRRVAQHIHDDTVQVLSALTMELELLRRRVDPSGEHGVDRLRDRLQHANRRVREVVTDLDPRVVASVAVGDAVRDRMQSAAAVAGVELIVRDTVAEDLPPAVAEALYRITTEAVGNAIRHSGTDRVEVGIDLRNGAVTLAVTDRGKGFEPAAVSPDRFGLRSMRARAQRLSGSLGISSSPTGTTVAATLPVQELELLSTAAPPIAEDIAAALRRIDTDLELAWTASPVGVVLLDRQGRISRANPAASALLGQRAERLVGLPLSSLPGVAPVVEGGAGLAEHAGQVAAGTVEAVAGRLVVSDGEAGREVRYRLCRVGAPAGPPWLAVLTVDAAAEPVPGG